MLPIKNIALPSEACDCALLKVPTHITLHLKFAKINTLAYCHVVAVKAHVHM